MKTAIYPFSGDPITYGHIDIITRAAGIFDHVIAAIGINPLKQYHFTIEERVMMAKTSLSHLPNITIDSYEGLLADFAREHGTNVIVRGIRNAEDFGYEWMIYEINDSIDHSLETFWMPCSKDKGHISSSAVWQRWQAHQDIAAMVPATVIDRLEATRRNV